MTFALGLGACYSPEVRDCTVTCASPEDCTGGQLCDRDGFCAMPEAANRCRHVARPDASVMLDARPHEPPHDARMPDAGLLVELAIEIAGAGKVHVIGVGICNALLDDPSCTYPVIAGVALQLRAIAGPDWSFDKWSDACDGRDSTCALTPTQTITKVKAKFRHDDADDAID